MMEIDRGGAFRRKLPLGLFAGLYVIVSSAVTAASAEPARLIDSFEDITPWQALASDGAKASAQSVAGKGGRALRLDFDLTGGAGYAFVRRALPVDLPDNYEISFFIRGDAPANNLEFKLADATGENVWWHQERDYEVPKDWREVRIKKRQIHFAWGPTTERTLAHAARVEFVVSSGSGGGRGWVEIEHLTLRALPPEATAFPKPVADANSFLPGGEPQLVFDNGSGTAWRSAKGADAPSLTVDLGVEREFGGLVLSWARGAFASRYDVSLSDDGIAWSTVRRVTAGGGGRDPLLLPESEARYIRLDLLDGPSREYALANMEIKDVAWGETPNAFFEALARDAPRGQYPRGFSGEQPYWTVVGIDGGSESGLLSEDGALETAKGGFSVEPFVVEEGRVVSWADVRTTQALRDDYLPIPSVTWHRPDWEMKVTAFASGTEESARLVSRYEIKNLADRPQSLSLVLAARPFQVNPPMQSLNIAGGVSPIHAMRWDGTMLRVNNQPKLMPLAAPDAVTARPFDAGTGPDQLAAGAAEIPEGSKSKPFGLTDETGFASGALVYDVKLAPGETRTIGVAVPLLGEAKPVLLDGRTPEAWLNDEERAVADGWARKLNLVGFDVPPHGQKLVDTLRTSLANVLIARSGPILRPGTRSYGRSWIRDGAMISESLVRLGHAKIAADYLRWFAPHQFENGKVPCCVDARGADPVPENDSNGQLIFLAAEVYRYTGDRALLDTVWPKVDAAARYLDTLRQSERTPANLAPDRRMLYGMLPPSISHEGYSAKPAYSYWDGFWGLLGYKDAAALADVLGKRDEAGHFIRQRDEFRRDLVASLRASAEVHGISYMPGAADLGDFDATATTIALAPGGEREHLPNDLLEATFERYWQNFVERRDGKGGGRDFTPYELRNVAAFVRLGSRDRAAVLLDYFMRYQRPAGWNAWAEVVGLDAREPRFIGDMPHAWIASDYIRSALSLFAYDRESDDALVLAAGLPLDWLDGNGIAIRDLRTPYGTLSYSLRPRGRDLVLKIEGSARPPGGFVLALPWTGLPKARQDGGVLVWRNSELRIASTDSEIVISRP